MRGKANPATSITPSPPCQAEVASHSAASSVREQALTHLLLWQLIAARWRRGGYDIEVLKGEVDRGGYDLVLEAKGVIRHTS